MIAPRRSLEVDSVLVMEIDHQIVELLRCEVDRARTGYEQAKKDFWRIAAEAPSGLPHPDGTQRLQSASRNQTAAMNAYTAALKRFNDFLLSGTIPEELKLQRSKNASTAP